MPNARSVRRRPLQFHPLVDQCNELRLQLTPAVGADQARRLVLQITLLFLLKSQFETLETPSTLVLPDYPFQFLSDRDSLPLTAVLQSQRFSDLLQRFQTHRFSVQESATNVLTPAILGTLLERFLEDGDRKSAGVFYTPPAIVAEMVQSSLLHYLLGRVDGIAAATLEPLLRGKPVALPDSLATALDEQLATVRVCDPAIGAGAFAVGMVQAIAHLRHTLTQTPVSTLTHHALTHSLYGMDIDPLAIAVTRVRLALIGTATTSLDLEPGTLQSLYQHLVCGNSLLEAHPHQPFDLLIANPPYVPINQIGGQERQRYEQKFEFASGRFNLFYLFLEQSSRLTKPQGICAFLVPDRLLLNTQCQGLRLWLLQQQALIELSTVATMPDIAVNQVTVLYRNSALPRDTVQVKTGLTSPGTIQTIPTSYFLNSPQVQFDFNYHPLTVSILEKIRQTSVVLGAIAMIKDGIIQGKVADYLFLKQPLNPHSKKLLVGRDIDPYVIRFHHTWVNYDPEAMMQLEVQRRGPGVRPGLWLRQPEVFERPKLLTRQTADRIIAAFDSDHYYYTNTLHGITPTDPGYDPLYLLAVLNSRLVTWYYRTTTAEAGKPFAQIKIAVLRQLPIPINHPTLQTPLVRLAQQIRARAAEPDCQGDWRDWQRECDRRLYEFYHLTAEEITRVEATT